MDFFSADYHLGHDNIRRFCNRPFDSCNEMNETIIANHNSVVGVDDRFFHLGDIAFRVGKNKVKDLISRLNGKIYIVVGNHENCLISRDNDFNIHVKDHIKNYIKWAKDYYELSYGKQLVVLSHYAMRVWNKSHHGSFHLYGHSHGSLSDDPNSLSIDVGVDAVAKRLSPDGILRKQDYRPLSFEEIHNIMGAKTFKRAW